MVFRYSYLREVEANAINLRVYDKITKEEKILTIVKVSKFFVCLLII